MRPIVKTPDEIEQMRAANRVVGEALKMLKGMIRPGIDTLSLDAAAEDLIRMRGGVPAFKGYPAASPDVAPFPGTICASINEEVVHGIPSKQRVLQDGDVLSVDVGVELDGFFGDAAWTFAVGDVSEEAKKLMQTGAESLAAAIEKMTPGATLNDVSRAVQQRAEADGYSVVRKFVGHGIGRAMHEAPQVPNFVSREFPERRMKLEPGIVLAVEPMVNAGGSDVIVLEDGWTVVTRDRELSVHFEHSIAVGPDGPIVLTAWEQ